MLLVTGICGRTGKYFIERLIREKYTERFRCIVRPSSDTTLLDKSGLLAEKLVGDLNDPAFLDLAMAGVTSVLHIAYIFNSPQVVAAALRCGVSWLILVHTTGIYSKYKSASEVYLQIEKEIETAARGRLALTILRPTMIYGNLGDNNMEKFIRYTHMFRIFPLINKGKNLLQPVHSRDLGYAYYDVLQKKAVTSGKYYILSGDRPITIRFMISEIAKCLGIKNLFIPVPLQLAKTAANVLKKITGGKIDYVERVLRMGEDRAYSHQEATQDFGFTPMPFETGIQIEVSQYLSGRHKT